MRSGHRPPGRKTSPNALRNGGRRHAARHSSGRCRIQGKWVPGSSLGGCSGKTGSTWPIPCRGGSTNCPPQRGQDIRRPANLGSKRKRWPHLGQVHRNSFMIRLSLEAQLVSERIPGKGCNHKQANDGMRRWLNCSRPALSSDCQSNNWMVSLIPPRLPATLSILIPDPGPGPRFERFRRGAKFETAGAAAGPRI